jgi:hypothetical protein
MISIYLQILSNISLDFIIVSSLGIFEYFVLTLQVETVMEPVTDSNVRFSDIFKTYSKRDLSTVADEHFAEFGPGHQIFRAKSPFRLSLAIKKCWRKIQQLKIQWDPLTSCLKQLLSK